MPKNATQAPSVSANDLLTALARLIGREMGVQIGAAVFDPPTNGNGHAAPQRKAAKAPEKAAAPRKKTAAPSTAESPQTMRQWLSENGYDVPARGRLSGDLIAAFNRGHSGKPEPAAAESDNALFKTGDAVQARLSKGGNFVSGWKVRKVSDTSVEIADKDGRSRTRPLADIRPVPRRVVKRPSA